ncbi:MAG: hypothetical protein GYA26_01135 [Flexilinea flocculi]|nr:hypothetical protein [Flexilinea flocculi]
MLRRADGLLAMTGIILFDIASLVRAWQSPYYMIDRAPHEKRLLRRAVSLLAMTDQSMNDSSYKSLVQSAKP